MYLSVHLPGGTGRNLRLRGASQGLLHVALCAATSTASRTFLASENELFLIRTSFNSPRPLTMALRISAMSVLSSITNTMRSADFSGGAHICRIAPLVLTYCNLAMDAASTASSRRDLLTVDLRGMKAALVEHARARGVSPSEFVRAALAEALRSAVSVVGSAPNTSPPTPEPCVRLSLRMSGEDRVAVLARARQAGLTPGAFVASLVAGVPVLTSGQSRGEHLAALVASNAEMATLARKVGQLASLFQQGSTPAAHEYRAMLDGVPHVVREHIRCESAVLADLRPARGGKSVARLPGDQGD